MKSQDLLKFEDGMDFMESVSAKSYTKTDLRRAMQLMEAIKLIELELFSVSSKVNLFTELNGWGVEASFYPKSMEYDIYIPALNEKIKEITVLFPEKCRLKNINRKIIFIAAHKIRHRLQVEGEVNLISPNKHTDNYLLDEIIQKIGDSDRHNLCSCSYLENPDQHERMEFDAMVVQHYVFSKLKGFRNWSTLKDIPRYIWRDIADDLLV